jgi:hypothetical protein
MWQRDPFPRENKYIISDMSTLMVSQASSPLQHHRKYILTGVCITLKKKQQSNLSAIFKRTASIIIK